MTIKLTPADRDALRDQIQRLLDHWLSKAEAARRLQVSEKTIDRMADRQQIERRMRQRPGRKAEPVFDPEAVDSLASERTPATVAPAPAALARQADPRSAAPRRVDHPVAAIAEALAAAIAQTITPRPPAAWLTIAEASRHTGLSKSLLKRLAHSGRVRAIRDRGLKLFRDDLHNPDTIATVSKPPAPTARGGGK